MNLPTAQPSNETPGLSLWQLFAAISLALVFGPLVTVQTATVGCRHHTINACIPVLEPLLGLIVATATFTWLATSPRRDRSVASGLKLAIVGIVIWLVSNMPSHRSSALIQVGTTSSAPMPCPSVRGRLS